MNLIRLLVCGLACAAGLLLGGCVSNAPMDITRSGRDSILPADLVMPNVRASTKLATAEDSMTQMGMSFSVHSGKVYRKVFTGGEGAPASLDLVNSSLAQNMGLLTSSVTYNVSVMLIYENKKQVITASATANTAWTIDRAAREAIERAVIDVAKQCEVYLAPKV